jgi:outer membrane translocation and assembly module TamA
MGSANLCAQEIHNLKLLPVDQTPEFLEKTLEYRTAFADTAQLTAELRQILQDLHNASYLEASVDTLIRTDSVLTALLHVGPPYEWLRLANGNIDENALRQSGFRERLFERRPLQFSQIREIQESIVGYAENNGYPFAGVWLDSLQLRAGQLSAQLFWDQGPFYAYGPLEITGTATVAPNYLQQYLGFETGEPYDRSDVLAARERLRSLPFVEMERDPAVLFLAGEAEVNLFLKEKKASRFDFLIGVLPNSNTTGRMLITGNFKGEFYNQFKRGERIFAAFEQLRPETQRLDLEFNYPYLLGLPFGFDLDFNLYKRDTTFLDIDYNFGVQYLLPGGSYLKAFWNNRQSRLLSVNEARILQTRRLPAELDLNVNNFGLEYRWQKLDYRLNPRQGWEITLRGAAGLKKILPNSKITALELEGLYDTLQLRSTQYELGFEVARFWPLFARSTLRSGLRGGYKLSSNPIYRNEQYRLGGAQLLRGFDEEFFFATRFTIAGLEYRLLIGQNAYLFLFGDYGYLEDRTAENPSVLHPYGFGGGITFETGVGLFGLSLAVGGLEGTPVDLGAPKVHFGYVSLF